MYKWRQKTIAENKYRDATLWGSIKTVLTTIGIQGMSGDETDTRPHKIKQMRRLKHNWLNSAITNLWVAVDTYEHAVDDELLVKIRHRSGNPGLLRSAGARMASSVPASRKLPRNYYEDEWWKMLNAGAQLKVAAEDPVDIPTLAAHPSSSRRV